MCLKVSGGFRQKLECTGSGLPEHQPHDRKGHRPRCSLACRLGWKHLKSSANSRSQELEHLKEKHADRPNEGAPPKRGKRNLPTKVATEKAESGQENRDREVGHMESESQFWYPQTEDGSLSCCALRHQRILTPAKLRRLLVSNQQLSSHHSPAFAGVRFSISARSL